MKKLNDILKKILFQLIYVVFFVSILIFVDYIYYCSYMKRIYFPPPNNNQLQKIKNVDFLTMSRLGYISTDKNSCFVNFETRKADNSIRIGCFGDSFTHGDEVNNVNDYPSLLQNIFNANGYRNVEVINFGNAWHGFHQSFIMWKYIGKKYNLNYVLLGPSCFQHDRDCKFNHTQDRNIYYLHARYIVKNNNLNLVDVIGNTYTERMRHYYRFIPHFRYLKYDRQAPPFLRCFMPQNHQLKNLFYYKFSFEKEARQKEINETHKLLLSEMADDEIQIILGHYRQHIVKLGKELKRKNLYATNLYHNTSFPYIAATGHNSPLGNQLLAQQMFDCLINKAESKLIMLHTQDIKTELLKSLKIEKLKLSEYVRANIEINNIKTGCFVEQKKQIYNRSIDKFKTASILAIKNSDRSILDAVFLPLDFELKEDMVLTMRLQTKFETKDYPFGIIKLLNQGLNIGKIDGENINFNERYGILTFKYEKLIGEANIPQKGNEVEIMLNNIPVLYGSINKEEKALK